MKLQDFEGRLTDAYEIRVDAVSECTLTYLHDLAEKALEELPRNDGNQQVTAVITERDHVYYGDTDGPGWGAELIARLRERGDTHVTHLVTVVRCCKDGKVIRSGTDMPSYNFRKTLVELNEQNAYALFVVQGHGCLRAMTVRSSMPE